MTASSALVTYAVPAVCAVVVVVAPRPVILALPYIGGCQLIHVIVGSMVILVIISGLSLRPEPFPAVYDLEQARKALAS